MQYPMYEDLNPAMFTGLAAFDKKPIFAGNFLKSTDVFYGFKDAKVLPFTEDDANAKRPGVLRPVSTRALDATRAMLIASTVKSIIQTPSKHWFISDSILLANYMGVYYIIDGHHRCAAAVLMGMTTIQAEIVTMM